MKVVILRGGSGAGKSTWIRKNIPSEDSAIFSTDSFFIEGDGTYNFDITKLSEYHAQCLAGFINICSGEVSHLSREGRLVGTVVVDNTNTSIAEFAPYAAVALAYGHDLRIVTFVYDPVAAYRRNKHGTPLDACMRQHARLTSDTDLIPAWWKHEYTLWDETWPWAMGSGDT